MILFIVMAAMALFAAAGYWWWSRMRQEKTKSEARPRAPRFSAVEIRSLGVPCAAALALDGQRFLAHQSPPLPLVGCTNKHCDCTFAKLSDRRSDERRWGHTGLSAAMFAKGERREQSGRRDAD